MMYRIFARAVLCLMAVGPMSGGILFAESAGGHAGPAAAFRRDLVRTGVPPRSRRSTDEILQELNARGRRARERLGLTDAEPQPVLDYLKDHRLFVEDRTTLFSDLIDGDRRSASAAFDRIMRELADERQFREAYLRPAMKKLAPFGFKTAAYNAMLSLMRGKTATGLAAPRVKSSFQILRASLLSPAG